jgi:hypothetical protein
VAVLADSKEGYGAQWHCGGYRLAGLEKLVAFGAMDWIVGGVGLAPRPFCCFADLYQHSLGSGHSGEAVSAGSTQPVGDERQGVDADVK